MKKQSFFMNNESGFFLPYVLFITTLIFLTVTMSVRTYQHEIEITHHLVDQLRAETMMQMGLALFEKNDFPEGAEPFHVTYDFPDGEVTIKYEYMSELEYYLHFTVLTNGGLVYTTYKRKTTSFTDEEV